MLAKGFAPLICEALDTIAQARFRWGTNDIALNALVESRPGGEDHAEIRSSVRSELLDTVMRKWPDATELVQQLSKEYPPTRVPLVIFDMREPGEDAVVYWLTLKVEGTLGVLN
jgi:hypothetical protein